MPAVKNEDLSLDGKFDTLHDPVTGTSQSIPMLDSKWIETDNVEFISYVPPPIKVDLIKQIAKTDESELPSWEERANFIINDLQWLLCQSHSQFWNHVIFNKTINMCLDSFLKLSPRSFDVWKFLPENIENLQKEIYRSVFMVYLRMSTHKETKDDFFTPHVFGEILYQNFLFDIPKIMDLCSLYGGEKSGNSKLLSKMLDNVFSRQPMYLGDLHEMIPSIFEIFEQIEKEFGVSHNENNRTGEKSMRNNPIVKMNDTIVYLYDTSQTLLSLFHTLPNLCQEFFKFGFVQRVAAFWNDVMPILDQECRGTVHEMEKNFLKRCKIGFIRLCHFIINIHCLKPLIDNSGEGAEEVAHFKTSCAEEFLSVVMELLPLKTFLRIYYSYHSVDFDMDIIRGCSVDETRLQYIVSAVREVQESSLLESKSTNKQKEFKKTEISFEPKTFNPDIATMSRNIHDTELNALVSRVKDMLPDYDDAYIVQRLKNFNYDVEKTINSLLEDGIPTEQQSADVSTTVKKDILPTRHSIFDNDEFDVFSDNQRIDISRVQKGKKRDTDNAKTVLDDKKDVGIMKEMILNYEFEYEDEYDDTYDTQDVGAQDVDSADELSEITLRRPFTTPLVLRNTAHDSFPEAGEERTPDHQESSSINTPETADSPGDGSQINHKDRRRGSPIRHGNHGPGVKRNQTGPNKERDRAYKDKNKGKFANHNRKAGAAKKQARGMMF